MFVITRQHFGGKSASVQHDNSGASLFGVQHFREGAGCGSVKNIVKEHPQEHLPLCSTRGVAQAWEEEGGGGGRRREEGWKAAPVS